MAAIRIPQPVVGLSEPWIERMVEYRKHVGGGWCCVDKKFCVQLLFVETNTGSAVCVAVYRFKIYTHTNG